MEKCLYEASIARALCDLERYMEDQTREDIDERVAYVRRRIADADAVGALFDLRPYETRLAQLEVQAWIADADVELALLRQYADGPFAGRDATATWKAAAGAVTKLLMAKVEAPGRYQELMRLRGRVTFAAKTDLTSDPESALFEG